MKNQVNTKIEKKQKNNSFTKKQSTDAHLCSHRYDRGNNNYIETNLIMTKKQKNKKTTHTQNKTRKPTFSSS